MVTTDVSWMKKSSQSMHLSSFSQWMGCNLALLWKRQLSHSYIVPTASKVCDINKSDTKNSYTQLYQKWFRSNIIYVLTMIDDYDGVDDDTVYERK